MGGAPAGGPPADPTLFPPEDPAVDVGPSTGSSRHLVGHSSSPDQPVPTNDILSGGLIPLGGGVYYNPSTGQIHGDPLVSMGSGLRLGGGMHIAV
jgi:hypothetical protein